MNFVEAIRLKSGGVRSLITLMKTTEHSNPGTRARVSELAETWMANYNNITLNSSAEDVASFTELDENLFDAVKAYAVDDPQMTDMMNNDSEEDLIEGAKNFIDTAMSEARMVLGMASALQIALVRYPGNLADHERKVFDDVKSIIPNIIKVSSDFIGFDPDGHDNPGLEVMMRANAFIEHNADFREVVTKLKDIAAGKIGK